MQECRNTHLIYKDWNNLWFGLVWFQVLKENALKSLATTQLMEQRLQLAVHKKECRYYKINFKKPANKQQRPHKQQQETLRKEENRIFRVATLYSSKCPVLKKKFKKIIKHVKKQENISHSQEKSN